MAQQVDQPQTRETVAALLDARREELVLRWVSRINDLLGPRQSPIHAPPKVPQKDVEDFVTLLISRLRGHAPSKEYVAFYHWVLAGRDSDLRLVDLTQIILHLKDVARELAFEFLSDELEAFRAADAVDDVVDEMVMKGVELYDVSSQSELDNIRRRSREIFAAWELEEMLSGLTDPRQILDLANEKIGGVFKLTAIIVRLYDGEGGRREYATRTDLPVALVQEKPQFLSEAERAGGSTIDLLDSCRRRQVVICSDVSAEDRFVNRQELLEAGVKSVACLPLLCRDELAGCMLAYSDVPAAFEPYHKRMLLDLSAVLGPAFERVSGLELSRRRMTESEVVARIGRALLELPTQHEMLQAVVGVLQQFRDYFEVSLFRVDMEENACVLVAHAGRHGSYLANGYRQGIGEGFVGICAQTGQTVLAGKATEDPRRVIAFEEERRAKSELAVPVKRADKVMGVMHFASEEEEFFTEGEVAALEGLSTHIAVALENARMLQAQRQARYDLERAHEQLKAIIRSTAVGITSTDCEGVYTHWSPSCEVMLGYTSDEVVGKLKPSDISADPYPLELELASCVREGQASAERTLTRKDGQKRVIVETRVPMHDEQGVHVGFTAYLLDITERKEAQEALRQERDKLNLVVDAMGAGLALFDGDKKLNWANSTLRSWFGLGLESIGSPCSQVYGCAMHGSGRCPLEDSVANGRSVSWTHELIDDRGAWHCYQMVVSPTEYPDASYLVVTFEITEQRRQNEQLKLLARLAKGVERSLELGRVLHLVLTCVTSGHALGFNRAFIFLVDEDSGRLEGCMAVGPDSPEEARRIWAELEDKGMSLEELLDATEWAHSDRKLTSVVEELSYPLEAKGALLPRVLEEGRPVHVRDAAADPRVDAPLTRALMLQEFVCVPLLARGKPLGVLLADNRYSAMPIDRQQVDLLAMFSVEASLAIGNALAYQQIRDQMDELRATQQKLIESERLASVGKMAGHLAHEIRNPLSTIGGFAGAIARSHEKGSKAFRHATIIYDECMRLEDTLAKVLDYTRPLRPEKEPVDINGLIAGTIEQFQSKLEECQVQVELRLEPDLCHVLADKRMLKQVIINLIKNACDAMEGSDERLFSIETMRSGNDVKIKVADTGAGMDDGTLDHLFTPFFTTKVGGAGLGLSVSQRIVRTHGGDLRVDSRRGSGSTFCISLPLGAAARAERKE